LPSPRFLGFGFADPLDQRPDVVQTAPPVTGEFSMSNRALWTMRAKHEWLQTPLKKKRLKRCQRVRIGQQAAMDRKAAKDPAGG
jgi:hypothetical protein